MKIMTMMMTTMLDDYDDDDDDDNVMKGSSERTRIARKSVGSRPTLKQVSTTGAGLASPCTKDATSTGSCSGIATAQYKDGAGVNISTVNEERASKLSPVSGEQD